MLILALLAGPLAIILGVVQGVFTIVTGEDNRNLRGLGASLIEYIHGALLFATWNREQKPFPFAQFPRVEAAEPMEAEKATGKERKKAEKELEKAEKEHQDQRKGTLGGLIILGIIVLFFVTMCMIGGSGDDCNHYLRNKERLNDAGIYLRGCDRRAMGL